MAYHFDEEINRYNTDSVKYDYITKTYNDKNILGMRIADSDFATPLSIINGLKNRLDQRVIGYAEANDRVFENIISFYKRNTQNSWNINPEWIKFTPGIVPILGISLMVLTQEGDEILTQIPGYPPLTSTVVANKRKIVPSELIYDKKTGDYTIDFDDLEKKITSKTRFFLLCNPHNPTGKVWKKEDLLKIGEFCLKHKLIIIADEIHGFLNYKENPYTPMASISPEIANITISCFSPGKLFDIPGAVFAFAVISNPEIRAEFERGLIATGSIYALRNLLGLTVLEHSYTTENEQWLKEKLEYLQSNAQMVDSFLSSHLPKIIPTPNEGTFLKWLNFNAYGLTDEVLHEKLIKETKIALLPGYEFGPNGKGFARMNIGCTKKTLGEALQRLERTFKS